MAKKLVEKLYDIGNTVDENGLSKCDEQKLRRYFENNKTTFSRNKDQFAAHEIKFHTCPRYNPCPICDKCLNKASHLYVQCETCSIPICIHTYKNRETMIKRFNFKCVVTEDVYNSLLEESKKYGF